MKPLDFPLLADENIGPLVVTGLRERGHDVRPVWDEGLVGHADADVLALATGQGRVVVTHDVAFGRGVLRTGASFIGVIHLRPGHVSATYVLAIIDALRASTLDVRPPFIAVAERQQAIVRVRVRTAPPW